MTLHMVDFHDHHYVAPDHRHWYNAGVRRGVHVGILIGFAFGMLVALVALWR